MKLKQILPHLYAENITVEALRSTITRSEFSMNERDEIENLYGEIPILRIRAGYDPHHIIIILY